MGLQRTPQCAHSMFWPVAFQHPRPSSFLSFFKEVPKTRTERAKQVFELLFCSLNYPFLPPPPTRGLDPLEDGERSSLVTAVLADRLSGGGGDDTPTRQPS